MSFALFLVLSTNSVHRGVSEGVKASDLTSALAHAESTTHRTFVIGGGSLYAETLAFPSSAPGFVDRILLTRIYEPDFECDVFMPDFAQMDAGKQSWHRATHEQLKSWVGFDVPEGFQEENGVKYEFQMWTRDV